jgi:hypothetical protein
MRRPYAFHLRTSRAGRDLLATANAIVNVGDGPLELRGRRTGPRRMAARQVIRPAVRGGEPRVLEEDGEIGFYDTRGRGVYWKFRDAARFELWRLDPDTGARLELVRPPPSSTTATATCAGCAASRTAGPTRALPAVSSSAPAPSAAGCRA